METPVSAGVFIFFAAPRANGAPDGADGLAHAAFRGVQQRPGYACSARRPRGGARVGRLARRARRRRDELGGRIDRRNLGEGFGRQRRARDRTDGADHERHHDR